MRPQLSLLVPTRHRTAALGELLDSLVETTARHADIEVVLVIDEDDLPTRAFRDDRVRVRRVVVPPGLPMGALNQAAYAASAGRYVMLLNDDVVARTPGWDERVSACVRRFADGIVLVHVNDTLMRDHLCTFPLVSRTFCELAGGLCPADYRRYRIDDHVEDVFNLLAHLGERRAVYLDDVVFEHRNSVVMPEGHREYHSDPAILAADAPRFLDYFPHRKEVALRLLRHIDPAGWPRRAVEARRRLSGIDDPFSLRIQGRQLGAPRPPSPLRRAYQRGRAAAGRLVSLLTAG